MIAAFGLNWPSRVDERTKLNATQLTGRRVSDIVVRLHATSAFQREAEIIQN